MSGQTLVAGYERVLKLAREQVQALRSADIDRFFLLQQARDAQFATLEAGQRESGREVSSLPIASALRSTLETVLRNLVEIDASLVELLSVEMAAARSEIDQLHVGQRALAGYATPQGHPRGLLFDEGR